MTQYKPRQLSYTNTVHHMGKCDDRVSDLNDYNRIRKLCEKMIISKMDGYDEKTKGNIMNGDVLSFVKEEKLDEFMEYFNPDNTNIERRKEFLDRDTINNDIVSVFSPEVGEVGEYEDQNFDDSEPMPHNVTSTWNPNMHD
tara:strand:+ start:146 stop:568 length:423 start_codon:yes stop_codon:yes gene_type:complete